MMNSFEFRLFFYNYCHNYTTLLSMIYIAFILFTLLILFIAFYQWQFYMVFTPTYYRESELPKNVSLLYVHTQDGCELEGALYEPENPRATLLFFAGRSHDAVALMGKLRSHYSEYRLLTFNYRSYGKSQGKITEKNLYADALEIAKLVKKNYGDFYILGFSLGSAVAAYVASKYESRGVFLIGSFDSLASLAQGKFVTRGFFPNIDLSFLFRYKLPVAEFMSHVDVPSALFVSKSDEITYIENARKLQKSIKNLYYYEEFDTLSHKELLWDERVVGKIKELIDANSEK